MGIAQRNGRRSNKLRMSEVGDVQNFESLCVHDKRIAELQRQTNRTDEVRRTNFTRYLRMLRIAQIHNYQASVTQDVGVIAGDDDTASTVKLVVRVVLHGHSEEVVF